LYKGSPDGLTMQKLKRSGSLKVHVHITLKKGVLDPQGKAIANALISQGFSGINDVRQGKFLELNLDEMEVQAAHDLVDKMCTKLLANVVIEDYRIDLDI